jgi:hypothetical protein
VDLETVAEAMRQAGHFPQLRNSGKQQWVVTAFRMDEDGCLRAPVVIVFVDKRGRWVLSSYRPNYFQVPDENQVPDAAVAVLQAMRYCMHFAPAVVQKYGLIELDCAEFESHDG